MSSSTVTAWSAITTTPPPLPTLDLVKKKKRFYLIKPTKSLIVTRPDPTLVTTQFHEAKNSWLCLEELNGPEEVQRSLLTQSGSIILS